MIIILQKNRIEYEERFTWNFFSLYSMFVFCIYMYFFVCIVSIPLFLMINSVELTAYPFRWKTANVFYVGQLINTLYLLQCFNVIFHRFIFLLWNTLLVFLPNRYAGSPAIFIISKKSQYDFIPFAVYYVQNPTWHLMCKPLTCGSWSFFD